MRFKRAAQIVKKQLSLDPNEQETAQKTGTQGFTSNSKEEDVTEALNPQSPVLSLAIQRSFETA